VGVAALLPIAFAIWVPANAVQNGGNGSASSPGTSAPSTKASVETIFGSTKPAVAASSDTANVEVGVRFTSTANGSVLGVRFYKGWGNTGTHTGTLWSSGGTKLASVTFTGESATGWQTANFSKPVAIIAGRIYVASYHTSKGHYAFQSKYFAGRSAGTGSVRALADSTSSRNGLYRYGATAFPTASFRASNYWVDVMFRKNTTKTTSTTVAGSTTTTVKSSTTTTATTASTTTTTAPPSTTTTTTPVSTGFPDASNTGVPAGVALTSTGSMTVTTAGAVIDAKLVTGTITIAAPNVVIERTKFVGTGQSYAVYVQSGSVTVQDCDVSGDYTGAAIAFDNWTMLRCDLHSLTNDGVKLGNHVLLQDTWMHNWATGPGAHADGGQVQNGISGTVVRHNSIDLPGANSALFIAPDLGPSSSGPLTIENNLLGGGGYTLFDVDGNSGQYYIGNISITGNRFLRDSTWGPVRNNVPVTWQKNVWNDTGGAISL
jgi:hypothetical protein